MIRQRALADETLKIAEVSVIEPVFTFPVTEKSFTITLVAAPIVYRSSRTLLIRVSLVMVILLCYEKK